MAKFNGRVIRIHVALIGPADPEIWRVIDVDPTMKLGEFHHVLQAAMGWENYHLHQFLDCDPFQLGPNSVVTRWTEVTPYTDDWRDAGTVVDESKVTIGSILTKEQPKLYYEYDFGDGWTHALDLLGEGVAPKQSPRAVVVSGEGRCPQEDSGGPPGWEDVKQILGDPQHENYAQIRQWARKLLDENGNFDAYSFDIEQANRAVLRELAHLEGKNSSASPSVPDILLRLPELNRECVNKRLDQMFSISKERISEQDALRMVWPYLWLLRRIGDEGVKLTQAGWLPPDVVKEGMKETGWDEWWRGKANREDLTWPIARLRDLARVYGLIRKYRGRLQLTLAAKAVIDDPIGLWRFLANAIVNSEKSEPYRWAIKLFAIEVAAGGLPTQESYAETVCSEMNAAHWWNGRTQEALTADDLHDILRNTWRTMSDLSVFESNRSMLGVAPTREGRLFALAMMGQYGIE